MPELQRYVNSNIGHRRNVCIGHNNGKDHRSYNGENQITNEYENTDWRDKKMRKNNTKIFRYWS